jgi:aldose 1-epimerase
VFGVGPDGRTVHAFTMRNARGMEVRVMEYGAIILSIRVSDRAGHFDNVALGFDSLDGYLRDRQYIGAAVGRYANRIAGGRFTLDGRTVQLTCNEGRNQLHGGSRGFHNVVWHADEVDAGQVVTFRHVSLDGEEGYPGTLAALVRYELTNDNALLIDFRATADRATHVNCTQHSYFNLAGGDAPDSILDHQLQLHASRFTPVDATLIPTGELRAVRGTPFDFTTPTAIGARIDAVDEQLRLGGGYDHNWVVDRTGSGPAPAATVYEPRSGRTLDILTTQPGIQFYSGNGMSGRFAPRSALALEPQHFPDSPNHPAFPSTLLTPGAAYAERIVYRFSVPMESH